MEVRIVVVGSGGVGKTALTVQFTENTFDSVYNPTIGGQHSPRTPCNQLSPQPSPPLGFHPSPHILSRLLSYRPTEDTYKKTIMVDGEKYIINVVDTAGQEEYAVLRAAQRVGPPTKDMQ